MSTSERPTRILRIITGLEQGGAEEALRKLLAHSLDDSTSSEVLSLRAGGELRPELESLGVTVHDLGIQSFPTPRSVTRLRTIVRRVQPDIIEGWMTHGNMTATVAQQFWPTSSLVWNVRSMPLTAEIAGVVTQRLFGLTRLFSRRPDAIVYNSRRSAEEHEALGYPAISRQVIHNGFDIEQFRPSPSARIAARTRFRIAPEKQVIGHVSRWHEHKDHRTLLEAFSIVRRTLPDAELVLIGAGLSPDNTDLVNLLTKFGVEDGVHLLGPVRPLHDVLPMFDCFILSSVTEAFPNALGEAMSCGIPSIATDVGDCRYVIGASERLAPVGSSSGLAAALLTDLGRDPQKWRDASIAARSRIEQRFSAQVVAGRYDALYRSLLGHE